MQIAVLGIDLGKNSCSLVGLDGQGTVVKRRRMRSSSVIGFTKGLPPCIIAMEACCGAHHLGREKNDDRDAEAIAEAATRPTMRFVEVKSEERLDMQTLHRARDRLVGERTALINQLRAILLERGTVIAPGRRNLERELDATLCEEEGLAVSQRLLMLIKDMREEWRVLDSRITAFDDEFAARAKNDEAARRLATIPGMGVLDATALVALIGQVGSSGFPQGGPHLHFEVRVGEDFYGDGLSGDVLVRAVSRLFR